MPQFIEVTTDKGKRMSATIADILLFTEPTNETKEKLNLCDEVSGLIIYKNGTQIFTIENYDKIKDLMYESELGIDSGKNYQ